jgi:DNA polymerase/3'-5' exonuclease PolX
MLAQPGPSWNDFVECINGGSIFAIITARGHNPKTLREAVYNLIMSNHLGINSKTLSGNLKRYRNLGGDVNVDGKTITTLTKNELNEYLNLCRFEPVTFGDGDASNPEEGKIKAMRNFISYCKEMAQEIGEKAFFKNDIVNNEIEPIIGFSDDDERNIEKMKGFLEKEYEKSPVKTYLTKGGNKKEV